MNTKIDAYRSAITETKRASIMQAARAQFLRNGFSHAGMTDIAYDADVSTATLYKHFRSKEILFAAIVEEASNHFRFEFATPENDTSLAENFYAAIVTGLNSYMESDLQPLMRIVIGEVPFAPDLVRQAYSRVTLHWYEEVVKTLNGLVAQNLLVAHDTSLSAKFLVGMIKECFTFHGLFTTEPLVMKETDLRKIREITELFLERYSMNAPDTKNVYWLAR